MRNPRILYVDTERVWRGGQEQLLTLVLGMRDRGYEVALAAPPRAPLAQRLREKGVELHAFEQRHELSLIAPFKLFRILRRHEFDFIHFNTPRPILAGSLASGLAGAPLKVCSRRVNFPLRSPLSRLKYNWLLDGIATVSDSIRETLIGNGIRSDLVGVVYEGVDLDWIDGLRSPGILRDRTRPRVGIVAHLSEEKGHGTLIQAVARLKGDFPEANYVLVGEGALRSELLQMVRQLQVEKQVLFTGFRSDSEALMKELDIFCLPSLSEGLSSAILCAMANSLPVIATDVGGIPELVVDGATGFLIPPGDSVRLAEALSRVLASESLSRELGRAGRKRIERLFTLEQKLSGFERFYQSLIARKAIR